MSTLRPGEWDTLAGHFQGATISEQADGTALICLPDVDLPSGWTATTTTVWFVVPVGYPAAQPDCFWVAADLKLESGVVPASSGAQQLPGNPQPALWFSWHLASWRPAVDSISTYARFILRRLADAR